VHFVFRAVRQPRKVGKHQVANGKSSRSAALRRNVPAVGTAQ
jgi:hypothetical protein